MPNINEKPAQENEPKLTIQENTKKNKISSIKIEKPQQNDPSFVDVIEEERQVYAKAYKSSETRFKISRIILILLALASAILIFQKPKVCQIIAYVCLGLAVVVVIVFAILNKRTAAPNSKGFLTKSLVAMDKKIFADGKYNEIVYEPNLKINKDVVELNGVYKSISDIISRNVIFGKYDEHSFNSFECALISGKGKARRSLFVGRVIEMPNNLHFTGRYLLSVSANGNIDTPNNIEDLVELHKDGKFEVLGEKDSDYKTDIGLQNISKIKSLSCNKEILKISFCIHAGKTTVYLSTSDDLNKISLENKMDAKPINDYSKFQLSLMEVLAELAK